MGSITQLRKVAYFSWSLDPICYFPRLGESSDHSTPFLSCWCLVVVVAAVGMRNFCEAASETKLIMDGVWKLNVAPMDQCVEPARPRIFGPSWCLGVDQFLGR